MKNVFVLLLLLMMCIGGRPEVTTAPARSDVEASMSVGGVKLTYTGPLEVEIGDPIPISVCLVNESQNRIFYDGAGSPTPFKITFARAGVSPAMTPAGRREGIYTLGDGVGSVEAHEALREEYDLARWYDIKRPGTYRITIRRDYNGVIAFPERSLQLVDLPIEIFERKQPPQ